MNKKFLIVGIILVILLGIGGTAFFINANKSRNSEVLSDNTTVTQEETPILEIFAGDVQVQSSGEKLFKTAVDKQKISVGDIIKTGADGRAQVLYPTHSVTRIDFNSQMTVEEYKKLPSVTKVKVDEGRIWSRVAKLFGKDDSNDTETDTLVASVRGTSYGLGILEDGNNKVTVTKSHVYVECHIDASKNSDVQTNNKLTTKCDNKLTDLKLDNTDNNDEWIKFNKDQDAILDERFAGSYDDAATPTPTPKPTAKPTPTPAVKGASTTAPTATATPTPVSSATPQPITITNVTVICGAYSNNPCGNRTTTTLEIDGMGYSEGQHPVVTATGGNSDTKQSWQGQNMKFSGGSNGSNIVADFPAAMYGTYTIKVEQNGQSAQKDITIGYQE